MTGNRRSFGFDYQVLRFYRGYFNKIDAGKPLYGHERQHTCTISVQLSLAFRSCDCLVLPPDKDPEVVSCL